MYKKIMNTGIGHRSRYHNVTETIWLFGVSFIVLSLTQVQHVNIRKFGVSSTSRNFCTETYARK